MHFTATLYRGPDDEQEINVTVEATVSSYADAIGCPGEYRSRYTGQLEVTLDSITDDATGLPFEPTDDEHEYLREEAMEHT